MRPVATTFHPAEKEKPAKEHGRLKKTLKVGRGGGGFPWRMTLLER